VTFAQAPLHEQEQEEQEQEQQEQEQQEQVQQQEQQQQQQQQSDLYRARMPKTSEALEDRQPNKNITLHQTYLILSPY